MSALVCPWDGFAPPTIAFCENRLCGWIAEPSNTWSNLIYFGVAAYLFAKYRTRHGALAIVTLASLLIGLGSFAFHASATRAGEVLDLAAMYVFSALFIAFNARRLWGTSGRATLGILAAVWGGSVAILLVSGASGIPLFIAQIVASVALELKLFLRDRGRVRYGYFAALGGLFLFSYFVWNMDYWKVWCDPDNHVFTGHAFWHVADGICLVWFYEFHRQFQAS